MVRLSIIFLFLVNISCTKIHNKNNFYLLEQKNKNITLNNDGYYYSIYDRDSLNSNIKGKGIYMRVLLNENSIWIVKNGYSMECGKLVDLECEFKMSEKLLNEYQDNYISKNDKNYDVWNWGKYYIDGDSIMIQWFYNKFGEYYLIEERGIIKDSTDYKINQIIDYGKDTIYNVDWTFKFKPYNIDNMYKNIPDFKKILN